ncbi:amidase family protein [Bordetella flabilis]|uniref:Indole acetimide hydrolase n=1 Tax=Bordetella flabilis TaxID=463014 RepID=A0A193G9K8_9BORD|nr:amidase family protein [Bordetella flabilis]ANN76318.1 indole acetimide hydrolase [Bordetella flabilis]
MQEKSGMSAAAHTAGLASLGVAAAADAIRKGEISSETYASALLERARKHSDLNAFITIDEEAVLEASRSADKARAKGASAPLLGVPIGIKDSYLTRGLRTTLGISTLDGFVPEKDADTVAEIKDAGGIVFGKNNLVEMSYGLTGHNSAYGQVKNPHDRGHVSGGSSSGSAASVAARLVPASLGGDTIGSIRVPASFCGVVGFKPTTGRWPRGGVAPISHTLDTTGVFARSVEDCLLIDHVVTRNATPDVPGRHGLRGVKLAYAPRQYLELIAPEVGAHFEDTLRRLRDAGAVIVEIDLGDDFSSLALSATWNIFFRETRDAVAGFLHQQNIPVTFEALHACLKPELKDVWAQFVVPSGTGFLSAEAYDKVLSVERVEIKRRFKEAFSSSGAEALLFPTTPCTAPAIEHQAKFLIAGQEVSYVAIAQNTIPTSAAGLPGISIPIGFTRDNLPIGLEIDGAHGKDRSLLDLARRIEAAVGRLSSPV